MNSIDKLLYGFLVLLLVASAYNLGYIMGETNEYAKHYKEMKK